MRFVFEWKGIVDVEEVLWKMWLYVSLEVYKMLIVWYC